MTTKTSWNETIYQAIRLCIHDKNTTCEDLKVLMDQLDFGDITPEERICKIFPELLTSKEIEANGGEK